MFNRQRTVSIFHRRPGGFPPALLANGGRRSQSVDGSFRENPGRPEKKTGEPFTFPLGSVKVPGKGGEGGKIKEDNKWKHGSFLLFLSGLTGLTGGTLLRVPADREPGHL